MGICRHVESITKQFAHRIVESQGKVKNEIPTLAHTTIRSMYARGKMKEDTQ